MKKRGLSLILLTLVLILVIIFWPVVNTSSIFGSGIELTTDKEKIGVCNLSIEIKEVKSFVMSYRKTFSFVLNDESVSEFDDASCFESEDGLCGITQMYYDAFKNRMAGCGLLYDQDLSYAALYWKDKLYFLSNGTEMSYSEIPWEIGTGG